MASMYHARVKLKRSFLYRTARGLSHRRPVRVRPRGRGASLPTEVDPCSRNGWDPVEVARAGRLEGLKHLRKAGRFLDLHSPHRAAAGEARRTEAWLAALVACKAGHAHVLRWLFRNGWPHSYDADPPWHLRDMAESWIKEFGTVPEELFVDSLSEIKPRRRKHGLPCFPPEVELYRSAMRAPACLEALLEAGARSPWICRAAVLEGKADLLRRALARGCPCDAECLFFAAREGQVEVLEAVLHLGLDLLLETTNRLLPNNLSKLYLPDVPFSAADLVQQAGKEAAARGQEACLMVLLLWHPDLLCGSSVVTRAAALAGHLHCLQLLARAGIKEWHGMCLAAAGNNLPCLRFALQGDPSDPFFFWNPLSVAAQEVCAVESAIKSRNLDAVKSCLDHVNVHFVEFDWRWFMRLAIEQRSAAIMQLLYEAGFPVECMSGQEHPAVLAIAAGMLKGAQISVKYSGVPELRWLDTTKAALAGEALLRYVHELGGTLCQGTTKMAAGAGQLGALRYAIGSGAPWDHRTLQAAIEGDSLDCLRYAHDAGCWEGPQGEPTQWDAAISLPVLRYVCEHMGLTWSAWVLRATADDLAQSITRAHDGESLDWQMALYTVQQIERREADMPSEDLPAPLAEAVQVRRERAAALAGVFFKADQMGHVQAAHPWAPVWCLMAGLPGELRERVAFMAHLVLPPALLC